MSESEEIKQGSEEPIDDVLRHHGYDSEVIRHTEPDLETPKTKKLGVIEIFGPTIQGEGPLAGVKTMFIRFAGCDYKCRKCDSLHAVDPQAIKAHARYLNVGEILEELIPPMEESGTLWVTFSGGNPCMWDLTELQEEIQARGKLTSVETQGTLAPSWLIESNVVVVSPKSIGMGEKFEPDKLKKFIGLFEGRPFSMVALKVVIFSVADIEWALQMQEMCKGVVPMGMNFFSLGNPFPPVLDEDLELTDAHGDNFDLRLELLHEYALLIEDVCKDPRVKDWKFLPQLHVLAFGNETGR